MKRLSLLELQQQLKNDEAIPLTNLDEISGGLRRSAGCCHGYCQECDSDTNQTSDDDNMSMDDYS